MTVEQCSGASPDTRRDLRLALHVAVSLQATIRHADRKAQVLLGLEGGVALAVLQQVPGFGDIESPVLLAAAAALGLAWLAGLAVSGWRLLRVIIPRLEGTYAANRFAFPADRPETEALQDQRNEAWDEVTTLANIATAKHALVQRSVPALIVASASAGVLIALTIIVSIMT